MTSKERMLAAMRRQPGDDVPCAPFMPSHFVEPWITTMRGVESLAHILRPPCRADELSGRLEAMEVIS